MKVRIISDLHLEGQSFTMPVMPQDDTDTVLVVAGDIATFKHLGKLETFLRDMRQQFYEVVWVPGNHDFYGSRCGYHKALETLAEIGERTGTHMLSTGLGEASKAAVLLHDTLFLGDILWTDFRMGDPLLKMDAVHYMTDYRAISNINPDLIELLHHQAIARLRYATDSLNEDAMDFGGVKRVLVTHHGVSWKSVSEQFKGDSSNGLFVSDLSDLILKAKFELVVHGHVHSNHDYMIGDSRVVVNPRGYARENPEFDPYKTVEL